jgi:plastocyanin
MIDAKKISSRHLALLIAIIVPVLAFYPTKGNAATVTVTVGNNCFCFTPASVTIHRGDTVQWLLLIVQNRLRRRFAQLKLCAHFL